MKRQWVIPDIHGCASTLRALLFEQINPTRYDELYFLGDYIDRGPDSKGVIDQIMALQEDQYNIRLLKGNHEDFLLRLRDRESNQVRILGIPVKNRLKADWLDHGGHATLDSFGVREVKKIPEKYIDWIRSLEYFIELDEYILVHAGFNFNLDHPFEDKWSMMWIKDFSVDPVKARHKRIIHGHVPVSLEFIDMISKSAQYDFLDLDNGIYMPHKEGFGNLVAFELGSKQLVIQPNLDTLPHPPLYPPWADREGARG